MIKKILVIDIHQLNIDHLRKLSFRGLCKKLGIDRKNPDKQLLLNIFRRFISSEACFEQRTAEQLLNELKVFWDLFTKSSSKDLDNIAQAIHHKKTNSTVLQFAARKGWDIFIAHTLQNKFTDNKVPGINAQIPHFQESALHDAALSGRTNTVALLLQLGADLYSRNARGQIPAHLATTNQCILAVAVMRDFLNDPEKWEKLCELTDRDGKSVRNTSPGLFVELPTIPPVSASFTLSH